MEYEIINARPKDEISVPGEVISPAAKKATSIVEEKIPVEEREMSTEEK